MEIFILLGVVFIVIPFGLALSFWLIVCWFRHRNDPVAVNAAPDVSLESLWFPAVHDIEALCRQEASRGRRGPVVGR